MVPPPIIGGWNADSDSSEDNLDDEKPKSENIPDLVCITPDASRGYTNMGPIEVVLAVPANSYSDVEEQEQRLSSDRYQKLKPVWLKATIYKQHIGTGEETGKCENLRDVIRARGKRTEKNEPMDQCGHIVANTLGGRMLDINTFPQNPALNCGHEGTHLLWRAFEVLMKQWLQKIPEKYNPRVKFIVKLFYDDPNYPDRPNKFFYSIQFLVDDDEDSETDENGQKKSISISQLLRNCIHTIFACRAMQLNTIKEKVKKTIKSLIGRCKKNTDQLMKDLFLAIDEIKTPIVSELS
ncbi:unnamed protein product [Adineta ricciae]|uniref:Uncharacterized protein n=1 Tax=Adineta ricciae TaxID=249248 RepID=A0A815E7P3_ADIRI|nr:unnamed protein product [Adineta ricciae]